MSARAWVAFAAVSTLWGIPYLFIKVAVDDGVPPGFLAFVRVALGAAVLVLLAWRAGVLGPLRGRLRWLFVYACFEIAIPFPLIAAGERHVASSLAAIIIAAVPLIVALLALRFDPAERATGSRLVGLLLGLAGVVALVGIDVAGRGDELIGAGAILLAAVGYAAGPMVFKRKLADLDPRAAMGASLVIAAIVLTPLAAVDPPTAVPSATAIVALVVLGLFCTAAAFVFFGALIVEVGPGRALVITYVAPVVAVALGVTVLGERPGAGAVAGLLLILAGSWLSTDGRLPPGLAAVVTRFRRSPDTEHVERRSRAMNAPFAWMRYRTTAGGSKSSTASAPSQG
ncbi:MAG TPA: DMT family transporter [Solirubrobacteraceae bacterium]|nr:DMT family transporter [Solirubrobacteraceae bacterium]